MLSHHAMWENEIQVYELQKGDSGLGFSILDYQVCVCVCVCECVCVCACVRVCVQQENTTTRKEQQSMSSTSVGLGSLSWFEILLQHGSSVS